MMAAALGFPCPIYAIYLNIQPHMNASIRMAAPVQITVKTSPFFYARPWLKKGQLKMVRSYYEFHKAWKDYQGTLEHRDSLLSCVRAIEPLHGAPSSALPPGEKSQKLERSFSELKYRLASTDGAISKAAEDMEAAPLNVEIQNALLWLARAKLKSLDEEIAAKGAEVRKMAQDALAAANDEVFFATVKKLRNAAELAGKVARKLTRPVAVAFIGFAYWSMKIINGSGLTSENLVAGAKEAFEGKNVPVAIGTLVSLLLVTASYLVKKAAENDLKTVISIGKARNNARDEAQSQG